MNRYEMILSETYAIKFNVEANTLQEAYKLANDRYSNGDVFTAIAVPQAKFIEGSIVDAQEIISD